MSDDQILAALIRLEVGQADMTSRMDRLEAGQTSMRAEVTKLRGDFLDELGTTRAAFMGRMDRLQGTLDQVRDEVVVNFGNTDRVERTARAAIDDNRITTDILRTMQRQIARLQTDVETLKGPP